MLLTLLPSSYGNFVETLLYGRESLTMKDVLATLNSRELKKRTEGTKKETGDGLYVRGGQIIQGHLKSDCPMKKSSRFVKKGKRDQDSDSSDNEGNAYFREALLVVGNDEMTEFVMDSSGSYHMIHMRDFLYDFKGFDGGSVQLGLRRSLISLGTLEKEGYTVKMRMGRIKLTNGCRVMMTGIRKQNCVYTLEAKVMTFGVQKHEGVHGAQDEQHVWFEVKLQGAQGDREFEVFQVSNDDAAVAQRRLEDKQLEKKTNTDCKGEEKHYGNRSAWSRRVQRVVLLKRRK
nr:hypothetical protein [Tanacetum cinerariifolium]